MAGGAAGFLSRISMSAIIGAVVAGGLVYMNQQRGMGMVIDKAALTASSAEIAELRAENAAIMGELENDIADLTATLETLRQAIAAQDMRQPEQHAAIMQALDAMAARLEMPLFAPTEPPAEPVAE